MTTSDAGWDDDRLLAELGDAVRSRRAVPDRFVEVGRSAFAWRDVDVDLAALRYDSAVSGLPSGVRAAAPDMRALTFEAGGVTIEVELSRQALVGQVVPARPGSVELWADGSDPRSVALDDRGWFDLGPPPSQPFRLCVRSDAGVVLTDRVTPGGDAASS
ncbi:MAG: hypothetical protein ACR2MO_12595 [Acidimicrobiales bacterium]